MLLYPIAKINLGLNIVGKRADGYHDLETVFYPQETVTDILDINIVPGNNNTATLTVDGNPVDCDAEKNLVIKAYRLLAQDYELPSVSIKLTKRIPMQAGMGGGSSDAAYTLKAMNELASLKLTDNDLERYALKLGADAPFFIRRKPCFATGVGEVMTPIDIDLSGYDIKHIKPEGISVSTAEAFRNIPVGKPECSCKEIVQNTPINQWKDVLKNDFETTVFAKHPELAELKQRFYDQGAVYATMTGSGSAVIGIFAKLTKTP
ncbi:MAG: 4-(cytidine 5'-diphospho)-2-C-methyl-D-erythritol kinase [Bacteroidaceae bacterium]|nr:4-(cytidine 5'-diphospho)-2-C-methyl-D-erythritol kinase [Bacteroidaceae bacterium]